MQLTQEQEKKLKRIAKLVDFETKGAVVLIEDIFALEDEFGAKIPELRELVEELRKERPDRDEIKEIVSEIVGGIKIPEAINGDKGEKGENGKDYILTEKDKSEIAGKIKVPVVEKIIEKTEVIREQPIEIIKEVAIIDKTDLTKEGEAIRDGLELLQDDDRLDKKAIKGLDDYDEVAKLARQPKSGGVVARNLYQMGDTNIQSPTNGQALVYDTATGLWINGTGATPEIQDLQNVTDIGSTTTVESTFSGGLVTNTIKDTTNVLSLDATARIAYSATGTAIFNWSDAFSYGDILGGNGLYAINLNTGNLTNNISSSVDWVNNQLIATAFYGLSLDWEQRKAYDTSGTGLSLDWGGRQLYDSAAGLSSDWGVRQHYDGFGIASLDWLNRQFINNSGGITGHWGAGELYDVASLMSLNWVNRTLNDIAGSTVVTWGDGTYALNATGTSRFTDGSGNIVDLTDGTNAITTTGNVKFLSGVILDASDIVSIDPINHLMYDLFGSESQNYSDRYWVDANGFQSGQYSDRTLLRVNGTTSMDWQNLIFRDSANVTSGHLGSRYLADAGGVDRLNWSTAGTINIAGLLQITRTTEQLRVRYDASNYLSTTVGSAGLVTFNAVGTAPGFNFADSVAVGVGLTPPTARAFDVIRTFAANFDGVFSVSGNNSLNLANSNYTGSSFSHNWFAGASVTNSNFTALESSMSVSTSATMTSSTAMGNQATMTLTGGGTITNLVGFRTRMASGTAGGTVTNMMGFYALSPYSTTGNVTNIYGFRVQAQAGANITNAYGFYSEGASDVNYFAGSFGLGVTAPSAKAHIISTTEQLRVGYDSSNYWNATTGSTGITTFNAVGSGSSFIFSDPVSVPRGGASTSAKVGGAIFESFADVSVGGAETDIFTNTLDASLLGTNGQKVTAEYSGNFVTVGTELTQLKVYLAGTAIWDSTGVSPTTGTTSWRVQVTLIRVSSTVVRYSVVLNTTGASGFVYCTVGELTGLTLTNTNILKITGTSTGVGSGAGDIVGKLSMVNYQSQA